VSAAPPEPRVMYMSPTETAEALGVDRHTIYRMLAQGLLPHIRCGRVIRIHRSAVESGAICDSAGGLSARRRRIAL
jgi:excisionase family DNA binding protein